MLHPATELKIVSAQVGYGVFATEDIPMGTITWALDPLDQILSPKMTKAVEAQFGGSVEHFTWTNGNGKRILCWDFGRFMNHSCAANSIGPGGAEFEIAVRDIAKGEELTCDYRTLNLEEPMDCSCEAPPCRGQISSDDLVIIAEDLDRILQAAFPNIHQVDQPLWQWIKNKKHLQRMANGPELLPSVLNHRWPKDAAESIPDAGK